MLKAAICLAFDDDALAKRVEAALVRYGYPSADCSGSTCPSGASAVVTDRPFASGCRRSWDGGGSPTLHGGGCEVPLVRVRTFQLPDGTRDAFATLRTGFTEEELVLAVTRAVRYGQHLAEMRAVRGPHQS